MSRIQEEVAAGIDPAAGSPPTPQAPPAQEPPATEPPPSDGGDAFSFELPSLPADPAAPAPEPTPEPAADKAANPDTTGWKAADWDAFKTKERERIKAEYAAEIEAERTRAAELEKSLEKYALADTPGFKAKYTLPKEDILGRIKRLADPASSPELSTLLNLLETGTATPDKIPDLKGLTAFQQQSIYPLVHEYLNLQEGERSAIENWKEAKHALRAEEVSMQEASKRAYSEELERTLKARAMDAVSTAKVRLGDFNALDQAAFEQGFKADPVGFLISSSVVASYAKRRLLEERQANIETRTKLDAALKELGEYRARVNGINNADRVSNGVPFNAQTPPPSNLNPIEQFMQQIRSEVGAV